MKRIKSLIILLLLIMLTSCLEITISYRVSSNGKVTLTSKYNATNENGAYLIGTVHKSLIDAGYIITQMDGNSVEGVIFSDMDKVLSGDITEDLMGDKSQDNAFISMASIKKDGNVTKYIIDYEIPGNPKALEGEYSEMAVAMYSSMTFRFVVTLPAKITRTNGTQTSANTVTWVTNFYDLLVNGKKFYCEASYDSSKVNKSEKEVRLAMDEMDKLQFKLYQYAAMIKYQKNLNEDIENELKKNDETALKVINILADKYYKINNKQPTGLDDLKDIAMKYGITTIIKPKFKELLYNTETGKFELLDKE